MRDKLDRFNNTGADLNDAGGKRYSVRGLRTFESFKNPLFRLYYYSLVGHWAPMQMQMVTRTLLIYRITGSGAILGLMALSGAVPMLLLTLFGGALADRVDKRKVLIIGQLSSGLVTLGVALALTLDFLSPDSAGSWWVLIVSSICQGIVMGLMMPSRASFIPEIVSGEHLMNAISLTNMGMNAFRIIAPAAAGFIIDAWDFNAVYYLMTFLYMFATVFLFFIPSTHTAVRQGKSTMAEVFDGFRYIRSETIILLILSFTLSCTILGMPFNFLLPMFTEDILHVGASGLGILMAVSGIGAIMVSFVLASMPNKRRGLIMLFGGLVLSLALVGFSFSTNWYLSLLLSVFIGLGQTGQMAVGFTLVQYYVNPDYRGRVMSFQMMGFGMASLGTVFGGILAETMGIQWSVGGLAILLVIVTMLVLTFSSRLRKLD